MTVKLYAGQREVPGLTVGVGPELVAAAVAEVGCRLAM